ncbi:MAG: Fic family protein [Trueperaceae bacterium]|nr:Fic family protein [Trueperaceae bacterium]
MFSPNYTISPQLLSTLKRIAVLVHDLNKRSPEETIKMQLLNEARASSAHASTTIEGNPLALTIVKQLLKRTPEQIGQSEREVLNYNKVLSNLNKKKLSEPLLLDIHSGLMQGLLPDEKIGRYRLEPVFVHNPKTGQVIFLPPDHQDVTARMQDLFAFIRQNQELDPVVLAGLFHKQFVLIHPFVDGNGRSVRLASTVLLRDLGVNLFNLLSFENYYNQNVRRYFSLVGKVGNYYELEPDFTPWLEYFAEGIFAELMRLDKILAVEQNKQLRLKSHHLLILEYLEKKGFITDKDYSDLVDRAKATRSLDFRQLVTEGLITRMGKGPATYYVLADDKNA